MATADYDGDGHDAPPCLSGDGAGVRTPVPDVCDGQASGASGLNGLAGGRDCTLHALRDADATAMGADDPAEGSGLADVPPSPDAEFEHVASDPASATEVGRFVATRYGESYEGSPLGCPGITLPAGRADRLYHSADPEILAAPPALYSEWECGQGLWIMNPANGRRLYVVRMDSCPGCGPAHVDLSEAGMAWLAGVEYPLTVDYLSGLVIEEAW